MKNNYNFINYGFINRIAIFLIVLLIAACSNEQDCFVADRNEAVTTTSIGDKEYSIYLRTSGFQEKEFFYVLYPGVPEFDACGKSSVEELIITHINLDEGNPTKLVVSESEMIVEYIQDSSTATKLDSIAVETR